MLESVKRKPYPQHELAERLQRALAEARISQTNLAQACGVTRQAVHGWLTDGRIGKHHLPTISALTGKGLEYFLVGLKIYRRLVAVAVILTTPHVVHGVIDLMSQIPCVLCKIGSRFRDALKSCA